MIRLNNLNNLKHATQRNSFFTAIVEIYFADYLLKITSKISKDKIKIHFGIFILRTKSPSIKRDTCRVLCLPN